MTSPVLTVAPRRSVGCTFFYMCTGGFPLTADEAYEVRRRRRLPSLLPTEQSTLPEGATRASCTRTQVAQGQREVPTLPEGRFSPEFARLVNW